MAVGGDIAGNTVTRGQSFSIAMSGYIAGPTLEFVHVWIRDDEGDQTEYPCLVTVNTDSLITAAAVDSGTLRFPLTGATVLVRPVISL